MTIWHRTQKFHTHREQFHKQGIYPKVSTRRKVNNQLPKRVLEDLEQQYRNREMVLRKIFNQPTHIRI